MGIQLAKAYVAIAADASGVPAGIASGLSNAESMVSGFTSRITGSLAVLGIGFGVVATGVSAFTQAARFEQTTIAFETMMGSADEAKKTLAELTEFAAKTPFEMPEIEQAARGLIMFGERGDELMKTLNTLGNAASGTSSSFGEIALIFNQVRGVGKLLTQDFRQLSTRGIISLQDIADHYGVTQEAASKMLSAGKISFADLKKILEGLSAPGGRFADMMGKQSVSLSGLWSTLVDGANLAKRAFGEAFMPLAKGVVTSLIDIAESVRNSLESFRDMSSGVMASIGSASGSIVAFVGVTGGLVGAFRAAKYAAIGFRSVMLGLKAAMLANPFTALIVGLSVVAGAVAGLVVWFSKTEAGQESLRNAAILLGSAWGNVKTALSILWEGAKAVFAGLGASVGSVKSSFSDFASSVIGRLSEMALSLSNKMVEWAPYVVAGLSMVRDFASSVAEFFRAVWDIAINWVQGAWSGLASYVSGVFESMGMGSSWLGSVFSGSLSEAFEVVLANLNVMLGSWEGLRQGIINIVSQTVLAFQAFWEQAKNYVHVKLLEIKGFFLDIWTSISEISVSNMMPAFSKFFMWIQRKTTELQGKKWLLTPEEEAEVIASDQARALDAIKGQRVSNQQAIASAIEAQEKDHQKRMAEIGSESLNLSKQWGEKMGKLPTLTGKFQTALQKAKDVMSGKSNFFGENKGFGQKPPDSPKKPSAIQAAAMGKQAESLIGKMSFADLGKKLQEQMMKQSEADTTNNLLQQQVDIQGRGVQVQEQILQEAKGGGKGGLAP